jgi:predicted DNA-binding protein
MIRSEKKLKELAEIFNKDNNILITDTIGLLRDGQSVEGVIGLLTTLYDKTDDFLIRKTIEGFMNDLKDQTVVIEVMTEIRKKWKPDTISMLVSSCWQSGLDYSDYSPDLVKIFMKGDYVTAVECLTVIEESVHKLTRAKKDDIIKIIEEFPVSIVDEKKALTLELILILER